MADTKVVVTILTNGETRVDAPEGITVEISYANALGDFACGCGYTIRRDEQGDWYHIDSPEMWGDDHNADPNSDTDGTCEVCRLPVYVDDDGDVLHVDYAEVFEATHGQHLPTLAGEHVA